MDPNVNTGGGVNSDFGQAAPGQPLHGNVAPLSMHEQPGGQPVGMPPAQQAANGMAAAGGQLSDPFAAPNPLPPTPVAGQGAPAAQMPSGNPNVADDGDLIEKEWVYKAKSIVEKTRHDPYTQNLEMSKLKADYLQKRYGKQLKMDN